MSDLNFSTVKMAHSTWKLKVRGFLDGRMEIDAKQLASHQTCELGKWIYSIGLNKYSRLRELQELEKTHKLMHEAVKQVVELKKTGKLKEAEHEFLRVKEASDSVLSLLTSLEKQVN